MTQAVPARPMRRPSRLEAVFPLAAAVAFPTLIGAALAAWFFLGTTGSTSRGLPGAGVAIGAVIVSLYSLTRGGRAALVLLVPWIAGVGAALGIDLGDQGVREGWRAVEASSVFFLGSSVLVLLLGGTRLLSPLRAMLLGTATAAALAAGDVAIDVLRPPAAASPVLDGKVWPRLIGAGVAPDPDLEYRWPSSAIFKHQYPNNPRGYFEAEPVYGRLDPRMFGVTAAEPARVNLHHGGGGAGPLRVELANAEGLEQWQVNVTYKSLPVRQGKSYSLTLRAKADEPRSVEVRLAQANPPHETVQIADPIRLETQPRTFTFRLTPERDEDEVSLLINCAGDSTPFDLEEARFELVERNDENRLDARAWRVVEDRPGMASLDAPTEAHGTLRVNLSPTPAKHPWSVLIEQLVPPVQKGDRFRFSARIRAEAPRPLNLVMVEGQPPTSRIGLDRNLELDSAWKDFAIDFEAAKTDQAPRIILNLGESTEAIELAEARLEPLGTADKGVLEPESASLTRFCITNATNSFGWRDRERTLERPKDVFRIACLGDSVTFGQGVRQEEVFSRRLEEILNAQAGTTGPRFEALNFGVCGYNTWQERVSYEKYAAKFDPQLVLIVMVHNDNTLYREEQEAGRLETSKGAESLFGNLRRIQELRRQNLDYSPCVAELYRLKEACERDGRKFAVVLYRDSDYSAWNEMLDQVTEGMKGSGVPILDLGPTLLRHNFDDLKVHDVDFHPNEFSHRIAAEEIAKFLAEEKLLPSPGGVASGK